MDKIEFFESIMGICYPWAIVDVQKNMQEHHVTVTLRYVEQYLCPVCGFSGTRHDSRERKWRHLDSCEYKTFLVADIPRVQCPEHGVLQVAIPWAEGHAPFTISFESMVIDHLNECSVAGVSRLTGISWDCIAGIRSRAVARGLSRRIITAPAVMGVDETSAKKRHKYITVVSDHETGHVLFACKGKSAESLDKYYQTLTFEQISEIDTVSMDMSGAYISSTKEYHPHADDAICFDRFHVIQMFNKALGKTLARENKELKKEGVESLKGTRYDWLYNSQNIDGRTRRWFNRLSSSKLKTARAWAIKETANCLWNFSLYGWAKRAWEKLIGWMVRSRIAEVQKLAKTIKEHLWGILNAVVNKVSNSPSEGLNAQIQKLKARACGYKQEQGLIDAVYFHLGGLDLYPRAKTPRHHAKP